ncbi:MAG: hypothetical protein R2867_36860 [Caldilineaceae bacterium]
MDHNCAAHRHLDAPDHAAANVAFQTAVITNCRQGTLTALPPAITNTPTWTATPRPTVNLTATVRAAVSSTFTAVAPTATWTPADTATATATLSPTR